MSTEDANKWNRIYTTRQALPQAASVLIDNQHLLPVSGKALDAACGLGANALLLARHGLETFAWDISDIAIEHLRDAAKQAQLGIQCEQRDIVTQTPEPNSFDIIVVSRFLDRKLIPSLIAALRENGLIFYQTFIKDKVSDAGPSNPEYLLDRNELHSLFGVLELVVYREEGKIGDTQQGFRNEAMLIAQRV